MPRSGVMISAGEASGDLHAARLLSAYRAAGGEAVFWGMGGGQLGAAGTELLVDCSDLAYIGFVDVVIHYRRIMRELERLRSAMRARRPDLVVLVDYPGFNMKLAHCARALGIPVLYYISPQIWAWRPHRIREIAAVVDMMAVLFRFEVDIYNEAGVPVRFVGHPLVDEVWAPGTAQEARAALGLDPGHRTVGLLPGSRAGEVGRIFPLLLETARLLRSHYQALNLVTPVAQGIDLQALRRRARGVPLTLAPGRPYEVMRACDAIVTSSGTATLETALMGVPMAVVYRVGRLNHFLMRRLITVDDIGLVNIVAGRRIVQEFIQDAARPEAVAAEVRRLLDDAEYAADVRRALAEVRAALGEGGASARAAALVSEMLDRGLQAAGVAAAGA